MANSRSGFFHPGELPGLSCDPCYPTDVASWRELYWAAFALRLQCVAGQQQFGWTRMGTHPSLVLPPWRSMLVKILHVWMVIANNPRFMRNKRQYAQHWRFRVGFGVFNG